MKNLNSLLLTMAILAAIAFWPAIALSAPRNAQDAKTLSLAQRLAPDLIVTNIVQDESGGITIKFFRVDKNEWVGFAYIECESAEQGHYYLHRFEIGQEYQSQRYGSRLFSLMKMVLRTLGCKRLSWQAVPLYCSTGDEQAQRLPRLIKFYQSHGGHVEYTSAKMSLAL